MKKRDWNKLGKKALMLRTCNADMTSYNSFRWPKRGYVEAPDWDSTDKCGGGLHGLPWGEGSGAMLSWADDAVWMVCEVVASEEVVVTQYGGSKSKWPRAWVVFSGDRLEATDYLLAHGGAGRAVVGAVVRAGDEGTATAGEGGTATAGEGGTATAGEGGTATAGYLGTATAGDRGAATAGDRGAATAGDWGTATAGDWGTLQIKWWDGTRSRIAVGYVGEDGIKPNVAYRVDNEGRFVEVE